MDRSMRKLKGIIVEKGATQDSVAKSAGITRSTFYRKLSSGGGGFTANEIAKIREVLELSNDQVCSIFLP
jgi:DNA-binding phage protein